MENAIGAGVKLLLHRHQKIDTAHWPFIDTKFNPNTGHDLCSDSYKRIYPWLLGRGLESLHLHLPIIEQLALPPDSETFAKNLFPELIFNMSEAVLKLLERYEGCLPFLVDRALQLQGSDELEPRVSPNATGPGDIFCAKGLLLNESLAIREMAVELLRSIAAKIERGESHLGGSRRLAEGQSHGMRMLFLAVAKLTTKVALNKTTCVELLSVCERFIKFVLHRHFDAEKGHFSEYIHPNTGQRSPILDPGHSTEFVGFSFSAIRVMALNEADGCGNKAEFFRSAKKVLPHILKSAMGLGFQEATQGMVKAVNNQTGEILDSEMPWWNLPETMRAALFAALNADSSELERDCLVIFAQCHNAYFRCYLNRSNMLFPYQTRCGKTGRVLDSAPAIPEGDPLYHSNLCFLEILELLEERFPLQS